MVDMIDNRKEPRKSLFAAAVIYFHSASVPVRIRNVSPEGALIESPELPEAGTEVRLSRGSLSALGQIRWALEGKAGLAFASPVDIGSWLSSCSTKGHQELVDQVVAGVREGLPTRADSPAPQIGPLAVANPRLLAARLRQLQQLIEGTAEALASDADVLKKHGTELQTLDAVARVIASLITDV